MTDDLLAQAGRWHNYLQEIVHQLRDIKEQEPDRTQGADPSGAVNATVGPGNRFLDAYITDDWSRRLRSNDIGEAVTQAARDAEINLSTSSVADAADSGIFDRLNSTSLPDFLPTPTNLPRFLPVQGVPATSQLVNDVRSAIESESASPASPRTVIGESESSEGWVSVTLSEDGIMMGCTIAPYWAEGRSGSTLSWAINEASEDARRHLSPDSTSDRDQYTLDRITSNATAIIDSMNKG